MKKLLDLVSADVIESLKGKSYDEAVKIIVDSVGKKAWDKFIKGIDESEVEKIVTLETDSAVNGGAETLNSEKSDEKVEEEEKEGAVADNVATEGDDKPAEDSASEGDETSADSSVNEDVKVDETSEVVTVDTVDTDDSEKVEIDPVYVEGLENRVKELEGLLHNVIVENAIDLEATKLGAIDVDDVKKFINLSEVKVDNGKASGVSELISELKKSKGYLFNSTQNGGKSSGFNPAKPADALDGVSAEFYKRNPHLR